MNSRITATMTTLTESNTVDTERVYSNDKCARVCVRLTDGLTNWLCRCGECNESSRVGCRQQRRSMRRFVSRRTGRCPRKSNRVTAAAALVSTRTTSWCSRPVTTTACTRATRHSLDRAQWSNQVTGALGWAAALCIGPRGRRLYQLLLLLLHANTQTSAKSRPTSRSHAVTVLSMHGLNPTQRTRCTQATDARKVRNRQWTVASILPQILNQNRAQLPHFFGLRFSHFRTKVFPCSSFPL